MHKNSRIFLLISPIKKHLTKRPGVWYTEKLGASRVQGARSRGAIKKERFLALCGKPSFYALLSRVRPWYCLLHGW